MRGISNIQLYKVCFLKEPTRSIVVIWVNIFQTELMAKIYSKSPVRAIGKVLLTEFS